MAGVGLLARSNAHDDAAETAPADADSIWGLHPGDILAYPRAEGKPFRFAVFGVYSPDKDIDYLRVAATTVDDLGAPIGLDLSAGVSGDASYVPVGTAARAMSLGEGIGQAGRVVTEGQSAITPGLVMIVPENVAAAGEPAAARFRILSRANIVKPMNGYAMLLSWKELATRLDAL